MVEGLKMSRRDQRVLLLADSRAAIAAFQKARRTGKARSRHLKTVVETGNTRGRSHDGMGKFSH